jgi:flagellum-specific peptidoglycan hydrolase FlgJ
MISFVPKEFVMFAGLLAVPAAVGFAQQPQTSPAAKNDPRLARLQEYFADKARPLRSLAADFLTAADRNGLDWRLLPSISIIESSGGKTSRNNNIFGWDSGHQAFPSVRAAIHAIAAKLANSRLYRHKDVDHILSTYNSRPQYADRVKAVMETLGPAVSSEVLAALD